MMRIIGSFVTLLLILQPVSGLYLNLTLFDFLYNNQPKTWKEAQTFCREKHADLITLRSKEENLVFPGVVAWIGLYREKAGIPWKWSRGDETASFINWNPGAVVHLFNKGIKRPNESVEEQNVSVTGNSMNYFSNITGVPPDLFSRSQSSAKREPQDNEHCASKWATLQKWINIDCGHHTGFICSAENLVLVKENKTWEEALQHCRSLREVNPKNPDGVQWKQSFDLATLITPDDHNFARERAQQATTEEVWTGLRNLGDEWFWVGGQPVLYQNIPNCPAARCGVLEKTNNTLFGIRDCSQKRNYFCFKKP